MHCHTRTSLDLRNKWNLLFNDYVTHLGWHGWCTEYILLYSLTGVLVYHEWVNKRYINETKKWKLQGKLPGCTEGQRRKLQFSSENAYEKYFAGLSKKLTLFIKMNNFAFHIQKRMFITYLVVVVTQMWTSILPFRSTKTFLSSI